MPTSHLIIGRDPATDGGILSPFLSPPLPQTHLEIFRDTLLQRATSLPISTCLLLVRTELENLSRNAFRQRTCPPHKSQGHAVALRCVAPTSDRDSQTLKGLCGPSRCEGGRQAEGAARCYCRVACDADGLRRALCSLQRQRKGGDQERHGPARQRRSGGGIVCFGDSSRHGISS